MNVNDPRWASIDAFVEENRDNILRDITRLVAVPSVEGAPEPGAPFPAWQSCRSNFCSRSADPCRGRKFCGVHQFSECKTCRIDRNTERYNVWFELSVTDKPDG